MFYFLCFIFTIEIVTIIQADVSDQYNYENYPIIYNLTEECVSTENQNLDTCKLKVWLVQDRLRLSSNNFKHKRLDSPSDIHECFSFCLKTPKCLATLRNRQDPKSCLIFLGIKYRSDPNDNSKSYLLKCCELKKGKIDLHQDDIPTVFHRNHAVDQANANDMNRATCKYLLWHHMQSGQFNETLLYKNVTLKSTVDCMNECLKDKTICTGIKTEVNEFDPMCHLYKGKLVLDNVYIGRSRKNLYRLGCSKLQGSVLKENEYSNLARFYEPTKVCKTVSTTNVKECAGKIWHVEEGVRMKTHFSSEELRWLGYCLENCGNNQQCNGISVDWIGLRCLYFYVGRYTQRFERQFHWTTYILKCCDELKIATPNKTNWLSDNPDSIEFPSYPVIFNVAEDCLPEENLLVQQQECATKAWLVVDNLRIMKNSNEPKTTRNVSSCFHQCLNSPQCSGITIEKSKTEHCWIADGQLLVNETDDGYKSFFLTCCKLKKKQISNKNQNNYNVLTSNFPIVFNLDSNCQFHNSFSVVCKYLAWHIQEGITFSTSPIRNNFTNKFTLDVLNECAKDFHCRAISVEEASPFVTVYRQFDEIENKIKTNVTTILYKKMCCQFPPEAKVSPNNPDLIGFSQPFTNCKSVSNVDVDCPVKVWFMRDGVRFKGHFNIIPLESVQSCLQECFENFECKGVSVDLYQRRCLLFRYTGITESENQPQWMTFVMKCCHDFAVQKRKR